MSAHLLAGRVSLVTGAGGGFGRELALGLADAGAAIAVAGRSGGEDSTARQITDRGGRAVPVDLDFATRAAVDLAFQSAEDALGPLDLAVHAHVPAASLDPCALVDVDDARWDLACEASIRSALFCCQAAHRRMRARGGRIVLAIPTLAGFSAPGFVPQTAAAEGVRVLAKSAARRWGSDGVTVNCIAPDVATLAGRPRDAHPDADSALGRTPDVRLDVAPVVALLASDAARFVTGETLRVDGGVWFGA